MLVSIHVRQVIDTHVLVDTAYGLVWSFFQLLLFKRLRDSCQGRQLLRGYDLTACQNLAWLGALTRAVTQCEQPWMGVRGAGWSRWHTSVDDRASVSEDGAPRLSDQVRESRNESELKKSSSSAAELSAW